MTVIWFPEPRRWENQLYRVVLEPLLRAHHILTQKTCKTVIITSFCGGVLRKESMQSWQPWRLMYSCSNSEILLPLLGLKACTTMLSLLYHFFLKTEFWYVSLRVHYVDQVDLDPLATLLPLSPKCWDSRLSFTLCSTGCGWVCVSRPIQGCHFSRAIYLHFFFFFWERSFIGLELTN